MEPSKLIVQLYLMALKLKRRKVRFIPGFIKYLIFYIFNCDLSLNAKVGKKIKFPHPSGIVIGDKVIIGDNVVIFQQVTLGGKGGEFHSQYPEIKDNVTIYSGAKILGGIIIHKNSLVGANSVVLKDVPEFSVVAGVPAKIIKNESN